MVLHLDSVDDAAGGGQEEAAGPGHRHQGGGAKFPRHGGPPRPQVISGPDSRQGLTQEAL